MEGSNNLHWYLILTYQQLIYREFFPYQYILGQEADVVDTSYSDKKNSFERILFERSPSHREIFLISYVIIT